jgi:hypothetical protein
MKAKIVTHYEKSDKKFMGDYSDIELFIDDKLVKTFGDYYHDKGSEKVEAFIEGVEWATGASLKVTKKQVADRDY